MSNYEDDQSEDGELAQSPVLDEMDFSLSDDDRSDSLVIKPPQAVIKASHRDRRAQKKITKDRFKESRKEKKHVHRDREKIEKVKRDGKMPDREDVYREKQFYRERDPYREKEFREKDAYREKELKERDLYREKEYRDMREKEPYRSREIPDKEMHRERETNRERDMNRDRDVNREREMNRDREVNRDREMNRDRDINREREINRDRDINRERGERDMYRDKEMYKEHNREREPYRESALYREPARQRDAYKDMELMRSRDGYMARDPQSKYADSDRKYRKEPDRMPTEPRLRLLPEESQSSHSNEKENRDKTSGDKELEDLRSRLLSKRIGKELQGQSDRQSPLDKNQQERRKKLIEAEREMEKRKQESRNALEARREERRRRGKKRTHSPKDEALKKAKQSPSEEPAVVMVSDASDIDIKSDSGASEPEEGEHSKTESEGSSSSDTESNDEDTKSEAENVSNDDDEDEEVEMETEDKEAPKVDEKTISVKSKSPINSGHDSGHSPLSHESKRSLSRSKSRSRSRSHSFSPPPPEENGKAAQETPQETDEQAKRREAQISSLPPYFPALQGCRSVEEFQCLNRIEEGTYGVVYRARDKTTEEIVALKRLKMEKEKEGFPITSLREINTLLKGQHPNIVTCREIVVGSNMDKIFIVMDYVEHDLKSLMETMRNKKQVFLPGEVKCLMMQLLKAVHHLHDNWILHRDLKTSNLLLSHRGILKVGDFGLAREYGSPLRPYTPIVVTLWYRAPELLLCCKEYSTPIDMWSVGCIFAELVTMTALFPGKSEVDQLNRIFKDLGTPSESIWPGYNQLPAVQKMTFAEHPAGGMKQRIGPDLLSEMGHALLQGFLTYDPERRLTADSALEHAYFKEQPLAIDPSMFPTWPAKSEGARRTTHSPRPPAGGAAYAQNSHGDSDDGLGFRVHASRSINVAPGFSLKF